MNDRLSPHLPMHAGLVDPALPTGSRLGPFEIQWVVSRSASAVVYRATDHSLAMPVAIQEYLPGRLVRRGADFVLRPVDEWQADVVARGLRTFIAEARLLARCDDPALVRVIQLFESNGTAYRVMPLYTGERLIDVRCGMPAAPDEAALRDLAGQILGAIGAIHALGNVHGNVTAANILLRADDRPLLLGPGAATAEVGSDLVDSLMATLDTAADAHSRDHEARSIPSGTTGDLVGLADVLRFCITGRPSPADAGGDSGAAAAAEQEPLSATIAAIYPSATRPAYSAALLDTLDATLSPFSQDRPLDVAQFRAWLKDGPPRTRSRRWRAAAAAAAEAAVPPAAPAAAATAASAPVPPAAVTPRADPDMVVQPATTVPPTAVAAAGAPTSSAPAVAAQTPWAASIASNFAAMSSASAASRTVQGSPPSVAPEAASRPAKAVPTLTAAVPAPAPATAPAPAPAHRPTPVPAVPPTLGAFDADAFSTAKEPFFEQSTSPPFDYASALAFEREFGRDGEAESATAVPPVRGAADSVKARVPPKPAPERKRTGGRGLLLKTLFVGLLLVAAAGIVAFVTGAFEGMPELRLDRNVGATALRMLTPQKSATGLAPGAESPDNPPGAEPAELAASIAAPASAAIGATSRAPLAPEASRLPAPLTVATTPSDSAPPQLASAQTPLQTQPPTQAQTEPPEAVAPPAATADPAEVLRARPPAAGSTRGKPAHSSESVKTAGGKHAAPLSPSTRTLAAASPATPRTACSGRTDFALYRCMQTQCSTARFSSHAQCVKLRSHDEID